MTKQDWIILRLMRLIVKFAPQAKHTKDFVQTCLYLGDKYELGEIEHAHKQLMKEYGE